MADNNTSGSALSVAAGTAADRVERLRSQVLLGQTPGRNADLQTPGTRSARDLAEALNMGGKSATVVPTTSNDGNAGDLRQQIVHLQDIVNRQSTELARYQSRYAPPNEKDLKVAQPWNELQPGDPLPPWVSNQHLMLPLLRTYDTRVEELESKVVAYEMDVRQLKERSAALAEENEKLYTSLQQRSDQQAKGGASTATSAEWEQLQERVQLLTQENDLLVEQQMAQGQEVDRLRQDYESKTKELNAMRKQHRELAQNTEQTGGALAQLSAERSKLDHDLTAHSKQVRMLEEENERLQSELHTTHNELAEVRQHLADAKRTANDLTLAYRNGLFDLNQATKRESVIVEGLNCAEVENEYLQMQCKDLASDLELTQKDNKELTEAMRQLDTRYNGLQEQYHNLELQLIQNQKLTDDAVLERERAEQKEKHAEMEIKRLGERFEGQTERVNQVLQTELESARNAFAAERRKLLEEMHVLEVKQAEAEIQINRAVREKRAVESEMKRLVQDSPLETERLTNMIHELNATVRRLERERNEASLKLESITSKLSREENRFEKDRAQLGQDIERFAGLHRQAMRQVEESKSECIKLFTQVTTLQSQLNATVEENKQVVDELHIAIKSMQRKHESENKELTMRSLQAQEMNAKLNKEIETLLDSQERLAGKWKHETRHLSDNYESIVSQLKEDLRKTTAKVDEVNAQYTRVCVLKDEFAQQVVDEKKMQSRLATIAKDAENKARLAQTQLQQLLQQEQESLEERKALQRRIDQLSLKQLRLNRDRRDPLGDLSPLSRSLRQQTGAVGDGGHGDELSKTKQRLQQLNADLQQSAETLSTSSICIEDLTDGAPDSQKENDDQELTIS